jgi:hypothetical protein
MSVFTIEYEAHGECHGTFATHEAALDELKVRANIPWNVEPNKAPCTNWKNCGRRYEIIEYDDSKGKPWKKLSRTPVLKISSVNLST